MPSDDIKKVREMIAAQPPRSEMTIPERRASMDGWNEVHPVPDGVQVATARVADVPVEWITAPNASEDGLLLYLHGGGYVVGSPASHRHFVAKLSEETGLQALLVDYRLAPENRFPRPWRTRYRFTPLCCRRFGRRRAVAIDDVGGDRPRSAGACAGGRYLSQPVDGSDGRGREFNEKRRSGPDG